MAEKMVLVPALSMNHTEKDDLLNLAKMLPKRYQTKATALLRILDGKLNLDANNHVIYEDELGSHLIDLIRYFVTPTYVSVTRPFDAYKFGQLLNCYGVPMSAVARPTDSVNKTWVKMFIDN